MTDLPVIDGDRHDELLRAHVHPRGRANPVPAGGYGLVVVGGGPAGLVTAFAAAGLGARVALVERGLLGGDCLNVGCVPSKALLAAAHAVADARRWEALGLPRHPVDGIDFARVMERVRAVRAEMAAHDAVGRLEAAGIDVFFGPARFVDARTLAVAGEALRFRAAVVATGARPAAPPFLWSASQPPLTNEEVFRLTERPGRLVVIGGGPVGVELAQAFARLGSRVTLVEAASQILPREDPEAAAVVAAALQADGVDLRVGLPVLRVLDAAGGVEVRLGDEAGQAIVGDRVLLALGRTPNVASLELEAAGIATGPRGVVVDDHLRTTNRRVWAAGDVTGLLPFTHTADVMARIVVQNALFAPTRRWSSTVVPWVTYSDPEVGHVGPPWATLRDRTDLDNVTVPFAEVDRARLDGRTEGFARAWVDRRGRVVGATVVGVGAGEVLHELALAASQGLTLGALSGMVHAYPTRSEVVRKLGDAWRRRALTPATASWIQRWLAWKLRPPA